MMNVNKIILAIIIIIIEEANKQCKSFGILGKLFFGPLVLNTDY